MSIQTGLWLFAFQVMAMFVIAVFVGLYRHGEEQ